MVGFLDTFSFTLSRTRTQRQQNGGHSNAYTDMDHTNYFFSVLPPFLEGTLLMEAGRGVYLASFVFFNGMLCCHLTQTNEKY